MAYKLSLGEFVTTLRHFLTNDRQGSSAGRTAEARQPLAVAAAGVRVDKTQAPYPAGAQFVRLSRPSDTSVDTACE